MRSIIAEADLLPEGDKRKALIQHSLRSESAGKLKALVEIASGLDGLTVSPDGLDADKWVLNAQNGVVNLRTGEIAPHDSRRKITRICNAPIDAKCPTPLWTSLLEKITEGNVMLERYLQKAIGYSLTGDISEQAVFILYGNGSNGKSTFLNVIAELLADYAQNTPSATFMQKKNDGVNNDIARLKGARFVTAIELDENQRLSEKLVKSVTGGEKQTTRFLYCEFFEYLPEFKVFFACNHKPKIRDNTNSIWRRIKLLPFTAVISEQERDKNLAAKILKSELPGILHWAVQGCLLWQKEGLGMPDNVLKATEEYREEMDTFGNFLDECCVIEPGARVAAKALRTAYDAWCNDNGEFKLGSSMFCTKLKEHGFVEKRSGRDGSKEWYGLRVRGESMPL